MLRCRRTFAVLFALALIFPFAGSMAQAQQIVPKDVEFYFETNDGAIVLSNVRLSFVELGSGGYQATLIVTPTQEEMDELLVDDWSHVDFVFTFTGLERSEGDSYFALGVSDDIRQAGAIVEEGDSGPVYRALGQNIDGRWAAGEPFVVLAPIFGYQPDGEILPRVSVEAYSTRWWFGDGCDAYVRTTNNITLRYCTEVDEDSRAVLYDEEGRTKFRLKQD